MKRFARILQGIGIVLFIIAFIFVNANAGRKLSQSDEQQRTIVSIAGFIGIIIFSLIDFIFYLIQKIKDRKENKERERRHKEWIEKESETDYYYNKMKSEQKDWEDKWKKH